MSTKRTISPSLTDRQTDRKINTSNFKVFSLKPIQMPIGMRGQGFKLFDAVALQKGPRGTNQRL